MKSNLLLFHSLPGVEKLNPNNFCQSIGEAARKLVWLFCYFQATGKAANWPLGVFSVRFKGLLGNLI